MRTDKSEDEVELSDSFGVTQAAKMQKKANSLAHFAGKWLSSDYEMSRIEQ